MKRIILAAISCCLLTSLSLPSQSQAIKTSAGNKVYICTGPASKRYHKNSNCRGLDNCSSSIKHVSIEYAYKIGRTPCKWCYK